MDMIFTICQLVERSWEHTNKCYVTFIDLKEPFDSVLREALWKILHKLAVLERIIDLIHSFHQGMSAKITIDAS